MIYLVCFCISVLFAYLARKSGNRSTFLFFSILSIAVTVLLAGLRDVSVGIDTLNYYEGSWARAMSLRDLPVLEYMQAYILGSRGRFEALFGLLVGITARTTGNYQVFLTLVHLIIVSGVYIGAFRMRKHVAPELTLFLFYLLYYGKTLNIFRQYMAMAILFAVAADIEERKHVRYLIFTLIATLMHNTGVIGLAPLLVFKVLYPADPRKQISNFRKIFTCAAIIGGSMMFVPAAQLLINIGVISSKYQYYIAGEKASSYKLALTFLAVEFVGLILFRKGFLKNNTHSEYYLFSSIAFLMLYVMGTSLSYGARIAAYFSCINIVSVGMLINSRKLMSNQVIVRCGIILVVLVYWVYVYLYRNASGTVPYIPCF